MIMNPWNVSERKAALLLKLQELRQQGRLQPAALARIEHLYAEGRDFAAERLAGLAIWAGTGSVETLATVYEHLGGLLRALQTLSSTVTLADTLAAWTEVAASRTAFLRSCGFMQSTFYDRLRQVHTYLRPELPPTVVERGRAVRRIVEGLAGHHPPLARTGEPPRAAVASASETLHTIEATAVQAAEALLLVGRQLWQVRLWAEWKTVAPSHEAFLEEWLGVGTALGARLSAVWESFADLAPQRHPLRRLELLITLAAGSRVDPTQPTRKEVRHAAPTESSPA
jgi:hypothetical protein